MTFLAARAHPRLRGADNLTSVVAGSMMGSSPLTRGGQALVCGAHNAAGLIPAYAGRTNSKNIYEPGSEAHPRLRGADTSSRVAVIETRGSSPLTRGGLQSR